MNRSLHLKLVILILITFLLGFLPEDRVWISLIFQSPAFRILAALGLLVAALPFSKRTLSESRLIQNGLPVMAAAVLFWLPMQRLEDPPAGAGDSLHLAEFIPVFAELFGFLTTPDELLELFIRSKSYLLLKDHLATTTALGLYSYLAGLLHILAVYLFLRRRPQILIPGWLILFFIPASAVYAGYIENYSMSRALLLGLLLLGWEALESNDERYRLRIIRFMAFLAGLTVLHHLVAGLILPALIWILFKASRNMQASRRVFFRESALCTAIAVCVIVPVYGAFYYSSMGPLIFADSHVGLQSTLPLTEIVSAKNILKVIQLIFLVPLSIALVPGLFRRSRSGDIPVFLGIAAISFLLFALIWNAAIGFPADWDLFSYFLIPLSVLTLYALPDGLTSIRSAALIAALTLAPAISWMTWLNETTRLTQENLSFIHTLQTTTLHRLQNDPAFQKLPAERQKMHLRIFLFHERLVFRLQRLEATGRIDAGQRQEILEKVDRGMQIYNASMHAQDEEYNRSLSAVQEFFYPAFVTVDKLWNGR